MLVLRKVDRAEATPLSQATAFALCAATLLLASVAAGAVGYGVGAAVVLGLGVLVGATTPVGRRFQRVPGLLVALLAFLVLAVLNLVLGGAIPAVAFGVVPLFLLGLDWRLVRRLRVVPFWCGLAAVVAAAASEAHAWWLVGAWFLLTVVGLWLLQADAQMGLDHGVALDAASPRGRPLRRADVARTIGIAVAGGLVLGLLVGQRGCLPTPGAGARPFGEGTPWRRATTGEIPPVLSLDDQRREQGYTVDQDGNRAPYPRRADEVVRDYGDILTVDDDRGSRVFSTDEYGRTRVRVTTPDGQARTFTFDDSGPQLDVYETTDQGGVVRRYRYESDQVLAQDFRTGSGGRGWTLPSLPRPGLPHLPSPGFRLPLPGGRLPGTPRLPSIDAPNLGRPGPPPWQLVAGLAGLAAAAGLAWYLWRHRRDPDDPVSWAEALVRRVDDLGRAHGHPRPPSTPVTRHTALLAGDVLAEPDLARVGRVASDALFGRTEPGPEVRAWAESVVDQAVAAHPPPSRRERRARDRAAAPTIGPPPAVPPV